MAYFHRLSEIVTCNVAGLLTQSENPRIAIDQIIAEMEEGLAGARRSATTAAGNADRLFAEIQGQRQQSDQWSERARESLRARQDDEARLSLLRKRETDDLIAGLLQQHHAAEATREHLATMQRALEARLAEALRRRSAMEHAAPAEDHPAPRANDALGAGSDRQTEVDEELAALKRELGVS